jgi:DNA-binding beta-propeller fold protein YncE
VKKIIRVVVILTGIFAVLDLALVRLEWFSSVPIGAYLLGVWDAISLWSGRVITAAVVVVPLLVYMFKKRWPAERKWQEMVASVFGTISPWRNSPKIVFPAFSVLFAIAVGLTYVLCIGRPQYQVPASSVLITPDGSEVYVITPASSADGQILRLDSTTAKKLLGIIDIGGAPYRMLVGPRTGFVYVLDVQGAKVTVINPKLSGSTVEVFQSTGKVPTSIVLTPDERKLYIANQQPSPHAPITVVELKKKDHPSHSIEGFNCPQSLGILHDGSKLYLATQCGSGLDPVFVIDSRTDKVVRSLEGFAVGSEVAVAGKKQNVYVSISKFASLDKLGQLVEEPARISVIDPEKDERIEAQTLNGGGSVLTASPDGRYLLYSTNTSIEILNPETQKTRSIPLGCAAAGIAIRKPDPNKPSLLLYAWLPAQNRVFFTGLDGLLP